MSAKVFETVDGCKTMMLDGWGRLPRHGRVSLYNQGCRCEMCAEANRVYRGNERTKRVLRMRAGNLPYTVEHGKFSTATNWGCCCSECKAAVKVQNDAYYARTKGKVV